MQTEPGRSFRRLVAFGVAVISLSWLNAEAIGAQDRAQSQPPFRGGLNQVKDADRPHPIRNDVAQPGEEIVTLHIESASRQQYQDGMLKSWTFVVIYTR